MPVLYNDQNIASVLAMTETQQWARTLRITIDPLEVHDRASLDGAFDTIRRGAPDAFMTTADPVLQSYRTLIAEFAAARRLPSMHGDRDYVTAGGLMFYGTSMTDMWRRSMWTGSSRARSRETCRWNSPPTSIWSST